jgi:PAT family beta-lactamase induction signal transducer AmpG
MQPKKKKTFMSSPYVWSFTTYFTEGFPYSIIRSVSSVFFRDMKVSLESIGLTSLFGLPWIIKFLWGPQVDEYSSKRRWLLMTQALLVGMMVLAALFAPLQFNVRAIAVLFFIGSFIAATHDIAIDGYYMEALDADGQAKFVGYRTMAYRVAWLTGNGVIVTIGVTLGWTLAFMCAAVLFGLFLVYHLFFLPEVETVDKPAGLLFRGLFKPKTLAMIMMAVVAILGIRYFFNSEVYSGLEAGFPLLKKVSFAHWVALILLSGLVAVGLLRRRIKEWLFRDPDSYYGKAFIYFMERDKVSIILAFIILLRAGEWTLAHMVSPFIVDLGIKVHYGWISGAVGLPASIAGAMLGGWAISKFSLKKVIWPFILAQNFTNVIYMVLAIHLKDFLAINQGAEEVVGIGAANLTFTAAVHGFDQFASGLGTAVLMTYLMRICHKEFKAAHYAIGSGLMNLTGLFAGVISGFIAGAFGYAWLFGISFVAAIPAMSLIPFLPYLNEKKPL